MFKISDRIRQARNLSGLSQAKLAERMGISRGACGHWERGIAAPSTEHLTKLAQILNVNLEWLAKGQGQIESPPHISDSAVVTYSLPMDDAETREVAELYYRLSRKKRQIILDLLREL